MHRTHHHAVELEESDGASTARRRFGYMDKRIAHKMQDYGLIIAMVLAVPLMILVTRSLRSMLARRSPHWHFPDSVMDLPTCSERLTAFGLDFGDTGSMRLSVSSYALDRKRVYDGMGSGVRVKGLELGGVVTQGLTQTDLFRVKADTRSNRILITPILHPLEVPVRAMILPLRDNVAAGKIRDAVRQFLLPVLPEGSIWLQDEALYHATLYHASSHAKPIHASAEVIADEERRIKGVCGATCPINAVLDRVVITPSGVVVACWQVLPDGGEPALLRAALGAALPNAPPREAQMVKEPAMLHTTVARLLKPPAPGQAAAAVAAATDAVSLVSGGGRELHAAGLVTTTTGGGGGGRVGRALLAEGSNVAAAEKTESSSGGSAHVTEIRSEAVVGAVDALSATLCGLRAQFGEVWFIEEQDLLALALNGRYVRHVAPLHCPAGGLQAGREELGGRRAVAAA